MASQIPRKSPTSKQLSRANEASRDHAEAEMSRCQGAANSDSDIRPLTSQDDLPKVLRSNGLARGRKRPTVSFLLPGQGPQREEIEEIWPDLVDMHKKQYNVAISPPGSHVSWADSFQSGGGHMADEGKSQKYGEMSNLDRVSKGPLDSGEDFTQHEHSRLPQRCAESTGCHLLEPSDDDCCCQKRLKAVLLDQRIANLVNGTSMDQHSVTVPGFGGAVKSAEFIVGENNDLWRASTSSAGLHKCEVCVPLSASTKSSAYARSTSASSFNPPTPHPKIYGELSENDIRVRIAQVHDELRILNLALARGNQTVSESDSDAGTPDTAMFYHSPDAFFHSSSVRVAKETADGSKPAQSTVEAASSTSGT